MTTSTAKDSIGSDSVRLYLSEIGQVPLLTADEEKDLGKKIKAGLRRHLDKLSVWLACCPWRPMLETLNMHGQLFFASLGEI